MPFGSACPTRPAQLVDTSRSRSASAGRRTAPWWVFVLAAAFCGYFVLLVYCDIRRPEDYGYEADFATGRMVLSRISPNAALSPAARAGLRGGDVIVAADGRTVRRVVGRTNVDG